MKIQDLLIRTDSLIQKGMTIVAGKQYSAYSNEAFVEHAQFAGFRSLGLSFIASLYGDKHVYYNEFDSQVNNSYVSNINSGINILQSIKFEIENGWLISIVKSYDVDHRSCDADHLVKMSCSVIA